ncbi:MAG: hypothetical protein QXX38_03255 [Candidatus Aenigmatarchaeota archaeon]
MAIESLEEELEDVKLAERRAKAAELQKKVIERAVKLTNDARKQYGNLIKSVLIFGSVAKEIIDRFKQFSQKILREKNFVEEE